MYIQNIWKGSVLKYYMHILFMVGRWLAPAILSFSPSMKLALDYYSKWNIVASGIFSKKWREITEEKSKIYLKKKNNKKKKKRQKFPI